MSPKVKGNLPHYFCHSLLLINNEFKRNIISWLAPLPILLGVIGWSWQSSWNPISLDKGGTWAFLLMNLMLAMVYGLQSFNSEADRKTLDFILTKPLSPYLIVAAKYCFGLSLLWGWWSVFNLFLKPDLAQLALPKGMGFEWVVLTLLIVHAVSFLSGLLAKGLERFLVITMLTGFMAYGSYYVWRQIFELISANFLWFDIPPHLLFFLEKIFPYYLTILCLAAPLIGVVWRLRSNIRIWRFKPTQWWIGAWLISLIIVKFAYFIFSPSIWPLKNAADGDWSSRNDIVLTQKIKSALKINNDHLFHLAICQFGQKPRIIYAGIDLKNPRFSPNGKKIVFSESGTLKILELPQRKISKIGEGETASWSQDGTRLIAAKKTGPEGLSQIYLINLANNSHEVLSREYLSITDLIWDSESDRAYILSFKDQIYCFNIKNKTIKELNFSAKEKPKFFGAIKPHLRFDKEDGLLFIGQVFAQTIQIYCLNQKNEFIELNEEKSDFRIMTNGPLLFNQSGTSYIWPRIDGGFVYQSSYLDRDDDGHDHDHEIENPF